MLLLLLAFLVVGLFSPTLSFAQGDQFGLQPIEDSTVLGGGDIRTIIAKIIRVALGLLGIIAISIMVYAGYVIMTSGGNQEAVAKGKKILINATIGLVIIMAAFSIVQFIINALSTATGIRTGQGEGAPPRQTFVGSGALGDVVQDHYPFREQTGVARNTGITITFSTPIDPASIILDVGGGGPDGTIGNCVESTSALNWETDCDRLDTSAIRIFPSADSTQLLEMAALAVPQGANGDFYTFVFRPLNDLGDDLVPVDYTVAMTELVQKAEFAESAFSDYACILNDPQNCYTWEFQTGTEFDFDPPVVTSVYPRPGATKVSRNTILQINFNEPVDPSVVLGLQNENSDFVNMLTNNFDVTLPEDKTTGEWLPANGYRTVEFLSDLRCGENSCGQPMYCLPIVDCAIGDETCTNPFAVVARTGSLIAAGRFESNPLSGVMDMAGNALDGNADGIADDKPLLPSDFRTIGTPTNLPDEDTPDNYLWNFTVANQIDRTVPYVRQITPGVDMQDVAPNQDHVIRFSYPMWLRTISQIGLQEFGLPDPEPGEDPVDRLWFRSIAQLTAGDETEVYTAHRVFGPNQADAFYFTTIPHGVKSINQNCIYPGRGPVSEDPDLGSSDVCTCAEDATGVIVCDDNCVQVNYDQATDTGCVQTNNATELLKPDVPSCIQTLEGLDPPST